MSDQAEFLNRLRTRMAKSMRERSENQKKEKTFQNVVHTRFDRAIWDEMREHPRISEQVVDLYVGDEESGRKPYDLAGELVQDLTYLLYKTNPRYEKRSRVHKSAKLNRKIEELIKDLPVYDELHDKTVMDPVVTMMATEAMIDPVRELLKHLSEEPPEGPGGTPGGPPGPPGQNPIDEANAQAKIDKDSISPEADESDIGEDDERPDDLLDDNERNWDDHDTDLDDESEIDEDVESLLDDAARELHRAASDINDKLERLENSRKGIGLTEGQWATMSPDERLALAEKLMTPEMQALSDMVGKMRRFALGVKASKIIDSPDEIYDVTLGNDIRHMLKSEFAYLATPETRYEFFRKFHDRELLQFKLRGKEDAGKGPIVVCIDKSGSMNGTPFHWAMAVAEALRRFCQEDGRDYYAMFFGNNNDRERFDFPDGDGDYNKVLNFLSCIANGGTQFDGVLEEAYERCRQNFEDNGEYKADIVFITDGYANLDEKWINDFNKNRKEIDCRVFSVFVGGARDMSYYRSTGGDGPVDILKAISDVVIPVSELTGESVKEIFAEI